jgi:hypothetical protein
MLLYYIKYWGTALNRTVTAPHTKGMRAKVRARQFAKSKRADRTPFLRRLRQVSDTRFAYDER